MIQEIKKKLFRMVPLRLRQRAVDLKNDIWGGYKHVYYAHCGEDVVVEAYFHMRKKKKGFYVDIGAHHPERYSNTALLYKQGWHGINVDPDSYLAGILKRRRNRDITLNVGVAEKEGEMILHKFSDPAVNTFSDENAARLNEKQWFHHIGDEKIAVVTLSKLLERNLPEGQSIDFMNIDVEDLDLEVIRSNDWNKYRPHLVAIEDRLFDIVEPAKSLVYTFMLEQGYLFLGYVGLTILFVDKRQAKK